MVALDTQLPNRRAGALTFPMGALDTQLPSSRDGASSGTTWRAEHPSTSGRLPTPDALLIDFQQRGDLQGADKGGDYALQLSIWARLASGRDRSRNQPIMLNLSMFRPTSNSTCFTARLPTIVPTSAGPSSRLQDVRISRDRQSQQRYRIGLSSTMEFSS